MASKKARDSPKRIKWVQEKVQSRRVQNRSKIQENMYFDLFLTYSSPGPRTYFGPIFDPHDFWGEFRAFELVTRIITLLNKAALRSHRDKGFRSGGKKDAQKWSTQENLLRTNFWQCFHARLQPWVVVIVL